MDISTLIDKLKDALYDSKPDDKLKMLKDLNSHHDRLEAYHDQELITAILRTLREVKYCVPPHFLGAQKEPGSDADHPQVPDGLLRNDRRKNAARADLRKKFGLLHHLGSSEKHFRGRIRAVRPHRPKTPAAEEALCQAEKPSSAAGKGHQKH